MARQPMRPGRWAGRRVVELTASCLAVHGRTCHLCGEPGATTADHLIPRSKGGTHELANLRPAHHGCNAARHDMTMAQWWAAHPGLAARVQGRRPVLPPSREWV